MANAKGRINLTPDAPLSVVGEGQWVRAPEGDSIWIVATAVADKGLTCDISLEGRSVYEPARTFPIQGASFAGAGGITPISLPQEIEVRLVLSGTPMPGGVTSSIFGKSE